MKVEYWAIGKTGETYLDEGIAIYQKRLQRYLPFHLEIIPDIRNAGKLKPSQLKLNEGETILSRIRPEDHLLLLDEKGETYSSRELASFFEKILQQSFRRVVILSGGAFGFSEEVYHRADGKISLSRMTFSHQMVRLFFLEQLYRSMTILKGEKYHND